MFAQPRHFVLCLLRSPPHVTFSLWSVLVEQSAHLGPERHHQLLPHLAYSQPPSDALRVCIESISRITTAAKRDQVRAVYFLHSRGRMMLFVNCIYVLLFVCRNACAQTCIAYSAVA